MMSLEDGRVRFQVPYAAYVLGVLIPKAAAFGVTLPPVIETAGEPAPVLVGHNLVYAPCDNCGGNVFAWPDEPALMMCEGCFNGHLAHRWRKLAVPEDWSRIALLLQLRPDPRTRNLLVGETAAELEAENLAHDVPIALREVA